MQRTVLIPEKGGNGSAVARENIEEVKEVTSEHECNERLMNGWGLLGIVPKEYWDNDRGIIVRGIVYVMYHTVM
ncbi:MAG: hypothetical protein A2V96_01560 [Candidatus Yonathbacteria bacterium RBG_16_43_6]|uniref:DUF1737 domain-containing protein n=2 Tax=Parcubacteria group TaxID=1794811 RepID=A0A1G2SEM0_9BACT|nr:MAG: hypothetical protein A2658_01795 [Candidatus Yonathbacteria bacterium RIFCSPHIGHO2_01_FULL_44_19]OHA80216.1 MAG: hypothetical protein A2V96_01560 [Candidatus Yonathbacteria bacterium RBG_16_43_6]OHA83112.1 MAG: hypothetical protein A3B07_00975 [Candidatus Yonathbacteria bacterium RIFCSPLOWO2_01_FULL_43_27]